MANQKKVKNKNRKGPQHLQIVLLNLDDPSFSTGKLRINLFVIVYDMKNKNNTKTTTAQHSKQNQHFWERTNKRRYILSIFLLFVFSLSHILLWYQNLKLNLNDFVINKYSNLNDIITNQYSLSFRKYSSSYRPKLILHVGPPKTGTTSIQCGLARFSSKLAQMDNYYYMGMECDLEEIQYDIQQQTGSKPIAPFYDLFTPIAYDHRDPPSNIMEKFEEHHRRKHNVIISSEKFSLLDDSEETLSHLRNLFPSDKWDVQVIVTYRRYYEWIPSMFYQIFDQDKPYREKLRVLPDLPHQRWKQYPNDANMENIILKEHPTIYSTLTYGKKFPVTLFDYHQNDEHSSSSSSDDLVTRFICHAIPDAHGTCNFLHRTNVTHANVRITNSNDLWFLQREAMERELITEELDDVSMALLSLKFHTMYHNSTNKSKAPPHQVCLTKGEEQFLWNISYTAEKYILMDNPTLFSRMILGRERDQIRNEKELEQQHLDDFKTFQQRGKLCSMDFKKMMNDPEWKKVFRWIKELDKNVLHRFDHATLDKYNNIF